MHHPLTPLTPAEISVCANALRSGFPLPAGNEFQFKAITLLEPAKVDILEWAEGRGKGPKPARQGYICYYIRHTDKFYEAVVDVGAGRLTSNSRIKEGSHGPADGPEIMAIEKLALEDPGVQAEIAKLELPEGSVVISDPWIYGSDGVNDLRRQFQCFLYLRSPSETDNPDSNHYAFPLSISPVVDVQTMKVIRIEYLPTGTDSTPTPPKPYKASQPSEYTPEHQNLRTDLKPLHVSQPEGASFTVTEEVKDSGGAVVEWQKWKLQTGFNHREGMVLYNIEYDGRSIVWRASLSDMCIPYADPRSPYHKKAAFDLGDAVRHPPYTLRHSLTPAGCWSYGQQPQTRLRLPRVDSVSLVEPCGRVGRGAPDAERHLHPRARRGHRVQAHQLPNRACGGDTFP